MANLFNSIRIRPPRYNRFDLSHDVKLTAKFGKLIPILVRPTLPGDVYKLNTEVLVRMAPMFAPIMTKVNVYTHYFFVPNRLLWDGWKDFITGGENGEGSVEIYPRYKVQFRSEFPDDIELMGYTGSLADYLNFPVLDKMPNQDRTAIYDALPFRAYNLIWNEYYRDQNLQEEAIIGKDKGGIIDTSTMSAQTKDDIFRIKNRAWKKDYFTSALPFAQRGDEVELPIQGDAPIISADGQTYARVSPLNVITPSTPPFNVNSPGGIQYHMNNDTTAGISTQQGQAVQIATGEAGTARAPYINLEGLSADLSKASSATINELRRAIKAQEFLELAARGGSRYIEQIYSYFGVRSSDARLQRPEFLGGGKSPVMISDVLQTSQSTADSAQASPAGHGVSVQRSHSFKFRCEEHGYIIGIMSIMPEACYMQGMPRLYQKFDRLDYYWPQFAHLGEQEIMQSELYYDFSGNDANNSKTFGYTPRYAEYKQMLSSVHGDFRSSLSFWHMGRIFALPPALNEAFISNVEDAANRVFNVKDKSVDKLWINIHHNFKALMKMPKYGTPLL